MDEVKSSNMGRPRVLWRKKLLGTYITEQLHKELNEIARSKKRSASSLVGGILEDYVEEYRKSQEN
jgi:metal-responsive CopG/Arc/MetJ family transcriptional regulator